jgi:uncharacterized membrane protein
MFAAPRLHLMAPETASGETKMGTVTKSIVVNAPVAQVFTFWKNFENFPRFMENVESIQVIGPDLTHWKVKGPLGTNVEWDAKTIAVVENQKIAWQSTEGTIETHGAVTFEENGPNSTKVTVGLEYQPPGGALGEAAAKMFSDPEDQLEEDLGRFKQVAEDGEFSKLTTGTPAVGDGSYTNSASSAQRKDVDGEVTGSGSGADEHSETRSV